MPLPLLLKLGAAGLGFWALSKGKSSGPSSPSSPGAVAPSSNMPIAQRMAVVLASGDAAAIRFEAGRLRQEGYPSQAAELEREAAKLDAERAAAKAGGVLQTSPPVGKVPAGAVTSPGIPQPPQYQPAPAPVVTPPIIVQTPSGPVSVPSLPMPPATPAVVIQTPVGPINVPSIPIPAAPPPPPGPPITVQTQSGPVIVNQPAPLPVLAQGELLTRDKPGQTYSDKTKLWQGWLASIALMLPKDVIGKFGPTTETATKNFQMLANAWLALQGKPKLTVDGKVGPQTLAVAALAHPPVGSGSTATYFGSFAAPSYAVSREPQPASPLPGIIPPMAPKAIEPGAALASRLAHNIATTAKGSEDRNLVQLFQMHEGLKPSGMYNASTAARLATRYGIVPGKPRYWTETATRKSKRHYSQTMRELGAKDPQRKEEWEQAGANL